MATPISQLHRAETPTLAIREDATGKRFEVRCGCGLRYDASAWERLPKIGEQEVPEFDGEPAYALELRNCECRSTLALEIAR